MSGSLEQRGLPRRWRLPLGVLLLACVLVTALPTATADQTPSVRDSVWAFKSAETARLWALTKGRGVTVAVVDSGVNALHPDLKGRVVGGGDLGDGSSANGTQDSGGDRGHGTELASLIAGTGVAYDGHGLSGLAPRARILSFGVYENRLPDSAAVAKAVRAAVRKGAKVVVIPPAGKGSGDVASAVRFASSRNAVVIAGAGAGTQASTTTGVDAQSVGSTDAATLPGVVSVAAVDRAGRVWPEGASLKGVVFGAPGVGILAAASDGSYWTGNDSAFAAAWVAGTAALIRAEHPEWTAAQTIQKIIDTAQSKGSGCAQSCGYGVVDPVRAVTDMSRPSVRTNPLLQAPAPQRPAVESPFAGVPSERILLFVVSGLAALALYVAVTALFVRRAQARSRYDETEL